MHPFAPSDQPLRLVEQRVPKEDRDRKALACYGVYFRAKDQPTAQPNTIWLRFMEERPLSAITGQFLQWFCQHVAQRGKRVLVLVWDHASWHGSQRVRAWIRDHNRYVNCAGWASA